jgi:hypothetical protein
MRWLGSSPYFDRREAGHSITGSIERRFAGVYAATLLAICETDDAQVGLRMKTFRYLLTGATMLLLFWGCAATPRVKVISDPLADFARYQTFSFKQPLGTDREGGTQTVLSRTLMDSARRELESLGYEYAPQSADLELNFFVENREIIQSRYGPSYSMAHSYYHRHYGVWTGYNTELRQFTESTLHVDVIDSERNQLIWEGISMERLSGHDLAFESENIQPSLSRIFADFPRRR